MVPHLEWKNNCLQLTVLLSHQEQLGKKILVRNGCISPHNIAIRAKQLKEQSQNSFKAEQNFKNVVSNSPCMIDISEIIAKDNTW